MHTKRYKKHSGEEEVEIWHVVYLDFVTTMMILFMALWAANQISETKGRDANNKVGKLDFSGKTFASGKSEILPEFRKQINDFLSGKKMSAVYSGLGINQEDESRTSFIISGHASKDDSEDVIRNQKKNMELSVLRALSVYQASVDTLAQTIKDKKQLEQILSNISVCGHSFNDPVVIKDNLSKGISASDLKTELSKNQRITYEIKQVFKDETNEE